MNKAIIYVIIAIFLALVVQPNISVSKEKNTRVPVNTDTEAAIMTNDSIDLTTCESKSVICIDPSYGGNDYGYVEENKIVAKDLTLELALKVGEKLEQSGYTVVYTRKDDNVLTYANAEETANSRLNKGKDQNAEYFICIDINAADDPLTRGYTIFTQANEKLIQLGNSIVENFQSINYSQFKGLDSDHYGNFPILEDSSLPTLYIEFGYMTNTQDYGQLTNTEYQDKIAESIAKSFINVIN